jgi:hypothetical protein
MLPPTSTFTQHVPISFTPSTNTSDFISTLSSISDSSLWSNLQIDGDGNWLITAINNESLDICNDGSYMPDLSRTACSGAFILRCHDTGFEAKGCFTDNSVDSDNYRGELLGSLGPLLLLPFCVFRSLRTWEKLFTDISGRLDDVEY